MFGKGAKESIKVYFNALVYLFFIIMVQGTSSRLYKLIMLAAGTREIFEGVERLDKIKEILSS